MRVQRIAAALVCAVLLCGASFQAAGALDHGNLRVNVQANGTTIVDENRPDFVEALEEAFFLELQQALGMGSVALDPDPYARWAITLTNPLDTPLNMLFTVSMPTTRMRSDEWQAANSLMATITDLNGDGASLLPTVPTWNGAAWVNQIMDSGVALLIPGPTPGTIQRYYFGGAPSAPLGQEGLSALAGGSASRSWDSSEPMLPDHSWIGDDVAWNTLTLVVGFVISPHDSLVLRTGIDITPFGAPVPEPGTAMLTFAGLLLAALGARRRGQAAAPLPRPAGAMRSTCHA